MKSQFSQVVVILIFFSLCFVSCQETNSNAQTNVKSKVLEMDKKDKLLRHVVIFKFKEEASEAEVNKLNDAFNALPEAIPVIKDFEWGLNDSPEDFHQDFTHCYLLTFESEEDRDSIYAPHPTHKAFGESLGPHLEGVLVVDYWTCLLYTSPSSRDRTRSRMPSSA